MKKMEKVLKFYGAFFFASIMLISCNNSGEKSNSSSNPEQVKENSGDCLGAQRFANTLDTRLPSCFKADNCEKRNDGTFVVHLTSNCGQDMVNDGRGSRGEREVRIGFDGKEYYVK